MSKIGSFFYSWYSHIFAPWEKDVKELTPVQEAALRIEFAKSGRELQSTQLTSKTKFSYQYRVKYHWIYRIAAWAILLLHVFEYPIWTFRVTSGDWKDSSIYPSYEMSYMPLGASAVLNLLCLVILWFAAALDCGFKRRSDYFTVTMVFIFFLSIQTMSNIMGICYAIAGNGPLFSTNLLAAFNILFIEYRYDNYLKHFLRVVPKFSILMIIVLIVLCTFTALGFEIFDPHSDEAELYFPNYGTALWNMLMILCGSNWPSPIIPAIELNRMYFFYFAVFVIAGHWGLLNLVLGCVYLFFRVEQVEIEAETKHVHTSQLTLAFQGLDPENKGFLTYKQVDEVVQDLFDSFIETLHPPNEEERSELIMLLDERRNGTVDMADFADIEEKCTYRSLKSLRSKKTRFARYVETATTRDSILNHSFFGMAPSTNPLAEMSDATTNSHGHEDTLASERTFSEASAYGKITDDRLLQHLKSVELSRQDEGGRTTFRHYIALFAVLVDSIYFDICLDTLILFVGILCFAQITTYRTVVVYLVLGLLEGTLKLCTKGWYRYLRSNRNSIDGAVAICILIVVIGDLTSGLDNDLKNNFAVQLLVLIRTLLYPRNIIVTSHFRDFRHRHRLAISYAFKTADQFGFLMLSMVTLMFFFAALGLQLFGGSIVKTGETGERIMNSYYGQNEYWPLNFNDMLSGLVTMFVLLHVNNTHITVSGFVASTYQPAELFFGLWYSFGVLLLLNVLTAVFVNQFAGYLGSLALQRQQQQQQQQEEEKVAEDIELTTSDNDGKLIEPKPTDAPIVELSPVQIDRYATPGMTERKKSIFESRKSMIAPASNFDESIFASSSQRNKLNAMILASVPRSLKSENEGLRRKSQWHSTVTDSQLTQPIIGQMPQGDSSYHVSNDFSVLNPLSHLQFNETPVTMKRSSVQSDYVARSHDLSDVDVVDLMQTDPDEDNIVISLALRKDSNQNNAELTHTQGSHEYVEDALMSAAANDTSIGTPKPLDLYNDFSNSDVSLQQRESDLSMRESSIWRQQTDNEKFKNASSSIYEWMYSESPISAYEKAAVLIQFARDGEEHSITCTERSLQCYRLRSQYGMIFKAAAACFALLRFFERPLWTYDHGNWNDSTIYPVSHLPLLSPQATLAIKWPLAIVLLIGIALELGYKESFRWNMFENISSSRIIRYVMAIHVLFVNLSLFVTVCSNFSYPELVTITSFGSLSYLLWFNRKTFQKAKIIARILPKFLLLLVLFFIVVMIFAGFGPIIFNIENVATHDDDTENFEYFGTFADSIWSVFVAITSSSYPNQVMPSYRKYREVCIYFISFITVGAFGFLNLVVVIVLVEFQKSTQLSQDTQRATRQILLMRAFEVLDEAGKGYLSRRQIKLLLNELYQHYRDFQKAGIPKESAKNILIDILDIDGDGKISLYDFSFFLDVIRIKLSLEEKGNFFTRQFPLLAKTYFFQLLIFVVEHRYIDIFVDFTTSFLLIVNILVNSRTLYYPSKISVGITLVMFVLYVIEIFCKCIAKGWKSYIHSFRNRIDFFMTSIIFLCLIAHAATHSMYSNSGYTFVVRILLFCRLILLPRNLRLLFEGRKEITKFTRLLRRVFSKITTLGIVFLCCGYVFASFGVFIYGGLIDKSTSNESLLNSTYAENGYWPLNFNDFASACMTLFCCLHVSDFDVIATGFTTTTSNWSRLYFTAWYVIGVLLLLNVVKSFFLGEFLSLFVSPKRLKALINSNTNKFNVGNRDKTSGVLLSTQQIADKHLRKRFLAVFQQSNKASGQSDYIPKHQDAMKRESATDLTQSPSMFKRDTFVMPFHYTGKSLTGMELNALEDHLSQNEENGQTSGLEGKETFASPPRIQASTANVKHLDTEGKEVLRKRMQQLALHQTPSSNFH